MIFLAAKPASGLTMARAERRSVDVRRVEVGFTVDCTAHLYKAPLRNEYVCATLRTGDRRAQLASHTRTNAFFNYK